MDERRPTSRAPKARASPRTQTPWGGVHGRWAKGRELCSPGAAQQRHRLLQRAQPGTDLAPAAHTPTLLSIQTLVHQGSRDETHHQQACKTTVTGRISRQTLTHSRTATASNLLTWCATGPRPGWAMVVAAPPSSMAMMSLSARHHTQRDSTTSAVMNPSMARRQEQPHHQGQQPSRARGRGRSCTIITW